MGHKFVYIWGQEQTQVWDSYGSEGGALLCDYMVPVI